MLGLHTKIALAASLAFIWVGSAAAQQDEQERSGIDEIVVTVMKRTATVQTTPAAISAITGELMDRIGIDDNDDLQYRIPSLSFGAFKVANQITIRGIGNENLTIGGDTGVAFHEDGVYISRIGLANSDFFDVERIEVLRGPQGTLYGRNATGGVINVISKKPVMNEMSGWGDMTYGNYNRIRVRGALNIPIIDDKLAMRASFSSNNRDGYVENLSAGLTGNTSDIDDDDSTAARLHILWTPTDDLEVLVTGGLVRMRGTGRVRKVLTPLGGDPADKQAGTFLDTNFDPQPDPLDPRQVHHDMREVQSIDGDAISASITWDAGPVIIKSITAYNKNRNYQFIDLDNSDIHFFTAERDDYAKQFTQELTVSSNNESALSWIAGVYYMHERVQNTVPIDFAGLAQFLFDLGAITENNGVFDLIGDHKLDSYAGFLDATYEITDRLSFTGGIRYTKDKKSITETNFLPPPFTGLPSGIVPDPRNGTSHFSNDAWTPRAVVEYQTDNFLVYASATRGFKTGGFNSSSFNQYGPEKLWAYEAGVKANFMDNRLQLNVAAFYYDYKDLQVFSRAGNLFVIENAATSTVKGVEIELNAEPIEGLRINSAISILDPTFKTFNSIDPVRPGLGVLNLKGNLLPRVAKFSASVGVEYAIQTGNGGQIIPRIDFFYSSKVFYNPFNIEPAVQPSWSKTDLKITYLSPDEAWQIDLFIKNIENKDVLANAIATLGVDTTYEGFYSAPRTYGMTIKARF